MRKVKPDALVHILTAIPPDLNPRKFAAGMDMTNRLRVEGTRNLLEAAWDVGVKRVIAEGVAFMYEPGPGLADEDAPPWTTAPAPAKPVVQALVEMEQQVSEVSGLTLRFGHLYGPGSVYAADGGFTEMIKARKLPIVGAGSSMFSLTHTRDAAMAILAALDKNVSGALNIVDDEPVPGNVFLPAYAEMVGAKRPQRVPRWLARPLIGPFGTAFMNDLRGADNARARLMLDWRPGFRSWRDGFRAELGVR